MSVLALVLGILPGFTWLFFYLQEDLHPEPRRLIAFTFVMGALSALVAYLLQVALTVPWPEFRTLFTSRELSPLLFMLALLLFSFIEELVKFAAAYFSVRKNPAFDEPVDAMIYTIVAALGFATLENIGALMGKGGGEAALMGPLFETATFRFVGATLLHTLTSGLVGYYWALSIRKFGSRFMLIKGVFLATILHAFFNYLILQYGTIIYALLFVIILGFVSLNDLEKLKRESV